MGQRGRHKKDCQCDKCKAKKEAKELPTKAEALETIRTESEIIK